MSYELMLDFDQFATEHFEEKKRYDALLSQAKKDKARIVKNPEHYEEGILEENEGLIKKYKEKIKYHKKEFEKFDILAHHQMHGLNVAEMYLDQVNKGNTRALRSVRYYHYKKQKNVTLAEKERWGIDMVKEALQRSENPVVSCSFGIDSIVTLYITRKALVELGRDASDIQVVWNDTLNEFLDVRLYAKQLTKDWNLNLLISKPKIPLKKIIDKHGGIDSSYFTSRKGDRRNGRPLSEKCCGTLKHEPMKRAIKENNWDLVINGLRADESTQRLRAGLRDGEYFYSNTEWKAYTCRPIMWMDEIDIWDYVEQENIPYNALYDKNMILEYPVNNAEIVEKNKDKLLEMKINTVDLLEQQIHNVGRKQAHLLRKLGYKLYTPRTGCQMCPIPIKYQYLQWMRTNYPKVFDAMIYTLGYGKGLLELIPEEVKEELKFVFGIDINEENAHEHIKDILEAKPCVFDKF